MLPLPLISFVGEKIMKPEDIFLLKHYLREAAKKVILLMAVPLRGGGGVSKGLAIKKTITFLELFFIC